MTTGWTPAAASSTLELYSGRVHLAEGNNVVVLELPYSTWRESRKFASGVRKYGKFSHFLTHPVVYGGQGKTNIIFSKYS